VSAHGTTNAYKMGCRCDDCKAAKKAAAAEQYQGANPEYGRERKALRELADWERTGVIEAGSPARIAEIIVPPMPFAWKPMVVRTEMGEAVDNAGNQNGTKVIADWLRDHTDVQPQAGATSLMNLLRNAGFALVAGGVTPRENGGPVCVCGASRSRHDIDGQREGCDRYVEHP
jgi:hypothetical protein